MLSVYAVYGSTVLRWLEPGDDDSTRQLRVLSRAAVDSRTPSTNDVEPKSSLEELPLDLSAMMAVFLAPCDLAAWATASRSARDVALEDVIWASLLAKDFPSSMLELRMPGETNSSSVSAFERYRAWSLCANCTRTPGALCLCVRPGKYLLRGSACDDHDGNLTPCERAVLEVRADGFFRSVQVELGPGSLKSTTSRSAIWEGRIWGISHPAQRRAISWSEIVPNQLGNYRYVGVLDGVGRRAEGTMCWSVMPHRCTGTFEYVLEEVLS